MNLLKHKKALKELVAVVTLLLLTIAFFWRTISGDVYQPADGGDLVSLLFPTYRFAAAQLSQGVLPLWNPHLRGGAPFIGDIQAGFLYPPNLLLFLLNPQFEYPWMQWLSIAHLFWAGLGTYVLLRSLRQSESGEGESGSAPALSPFAALFGALAFQFSDALFIHLGNLNLIAVLSWMPWVLAAFERTLGLSSLRWAVITALCFTIGNYAGHAQSSLYVGLALIGYWIFRSLFKAQSRPNQPANSFKSTLALLLAQAKYPIVICLLTLLLNAPMLLPAVEMAGYTARANFTYQDAIAYSLDPVQAVAGLLSPGFFGRGPALHWSYWDRVETPYVGVVALLMAIAALALTDRQRRRALSPCVGIAPVGFLISLGL